MLTGQKIMKPVQFICSDDISEVKLSRQVCAYLLSDWFHKIECQEIVRVRLCVRVTCFPVTVWESVARDHLL